MNLTFRNQLLLLKIFTVILTTAILGVGSHLLFVSTFDRLQERHLIHISREGALSVAATLQSLAQQIEKLDMVTFRERYGDRPLEKHFLEFFRNLPDSYAVVSLLNEQGDEIVKLVNGQPAERYFNYQHDSLIQQARREPNRTHISAKLQDPQLGEPTIRLAYSYVSYFGEEFLGTLVLTQPLKIFGRQLSDLGRYDEAKLSLISAQGDILTFNQPEQIFQRVPFTLDSSPVRHQLFGQDMVVVASPISAEGWKVMATLPWQIYRAAVNKMDRLAVGVCLLVVFLGSLLSWKLTGILMRNINKLIDFAEQVGQGNYSHQLALDSGKEFNQLNKAFNRMVIDLDRHRRSRDSLQKIIETVIDPLIVTDREGLLVQANQATLELFSCESAQIISRSLADLFLDPPGILLRTEFTQGLLGARVSNLETVIRNCHGDGIEVLFSSAPCAGETDEFGVVCILKDATELMAVRAAREKALLQAEEARRRVDVLLRSVPDGLVVTDPLGSVLMINRPAEKLLGAEAEKLVPVLTRELLDENCAQGRSIDIPLARNDSGALCVVQVHASEVRDNQNHLSGLVMLLRDVSRERSMEQMKNEFISTAAHELRTPLTSILGYSELMLEPTNAERFSDDETRGFLEEILGRAETLARIIDDLLSISRIESGQPLALEIVSADISIILERVVEQFKLTAGSHRYELKLLKRGRLAQVDAGRLQQALENLVSNAVKYSEDGSLIRVRGEECPDRYLIRIEDQGLGMLPEQVTRIFDKFYRADYSNTKTSGLGIGMSIVKQIIEGHSGSIEVFSTPGKGTRIEVSLPLDA